jgi:eukaryotic-like serine/threonine-protein kinase
MSQQPPLDRTVSLPSAEAALDAAPAAAFGPDSGPPLPLGASVLQALGATLSAVPRVHLAEPGAEPEPPVPRPPTAELPGEAVPGGRYQLHGEIARGGMGAVLKGRDTDLGREVAVKVLLETHQGKTELLQRFVEEAQIGGQLQHPGIVPVYDLGQLPDRRPYFTMKLVKGRTLAAELRERADPAQDRPRFLKVFEQVCQTLAYAHARGVVHRDLKPANVMVGAFGEVQVMDWGLAKVLPQGGLADERPTPAEPAEASAIQTARGEGAGTATAAGAPTQAGSVLGTPAYMAPEQARGEVSSLDERCDVFGLGAILCEILTGQPPYSGGDRADLLRRAAVGDLADAWARLEGCGADAELVALAQHCLWPEPSGRPRHAGEVAAAVTGYLQSVEVRLRRAEAERAAAQVKATEERKRRRITLALAGTVLLTVCLGSGGWLWLEHSWAAHRARVAAQVTLALQDATLKQGAARATGDLAQWLGALADADRARALAADGQVEEGLRQRAEELRTSITAETAAARQKMEEARQDQELRARLERARLEAEALQDGQLNWLAPAAAYADIFRAYGMDVLALEPAEAAARIRRRAARAQLVAALDDWARIWATQSLLRPDDEAKNWPRLLKVARLADPDPYRNRVRHIFVRRDTRALLKLAAEADVARLPPATLAFLAEGLRAYGSAADTAALLRRAQRQYPNDFWINWRLAGALERLRPPRHEEAVRFYTAALASRGPSSLVYPRLAESLRAAGAEEEALAVLRRALEHDPNEPFTHFELGTQLFRAKDYRGAAKHFRKLIALKPANPALRQGGPFFLAGALFYGGRHEEGLATYRDALRQFPNLAEGHSMYGDALKELGRIDEAIAAYREAVRLKSRTAGTYNSLGALLCDHKGDYEKAAAAFREAIRLNPNDPHAHFNLGNALGHQGRWEEAAAAYREALGKYPDRAVARYSLGLAQDNLGQPEEALASLTEAIKLKPTLANAHDRIGQILLRKRDFPGAAAAFGKVVELRPDDADAHLHLGLALRGQSLTDRAIAALEKAVKLRPGSAPGHYELGRTYWTHGDKEKAVASLREATRLKPDYSDAQYDLGTDLLNLGRPAEAVAPLREAVRLRPDHAERHCNLGLALMRTERFAEALPLLERGHKLGSRRKDWKYPSAVWARDCRSFIGFEKRLLALVRGEEQLVGAELGRFVVYCEVYKKYHATAATLLKDLMASEPVRANNVGLGVRFKAAQNAALAGCGRGKDVPPPDEKARAGWRRQALVWLRADLALWEKHLQDGTPQARRAVRQGLENWRRDPALAGLRDDDALKRLSAEERQAWRKLWADAAALLKRARAGS